MHNTASLAKKLVISKLWVYISTKAKQQSYLSLNINGNNFRHSVILLGHYLLINFSYV